MPLLVHAMAGPLAVHRAAVEHPRLADGKIADVDHLLDFAFTFGQDLAGFQGYQFTQGVLLRPQCIADLTHHFAALRRRDIAPELECLPGGFQHFLIFPGFAAADMTQQAAVDRANGMDNGSRARQPRAVADDRGFRLLRPSSLKTDALIACRI